MSVSKLIDSDFSFGQGKSNYITGSNEVQQNIVTRIKEVKNDFFLNIDGGIDWYNLLSAKNVNELIKNDIIDIVLATAGTKSIISVNVETDLPNRTALISLEYTDIYNKEFLKEIGITL